VRECLARRSGTAATCDIVNEVLIHGVSAGRLFKVSHIIKTLERLGTYQQGCWYAPSSAG
jgi:hypothetical protein